VYYLLFDRLSCFGPQGSGAVVYTSSRPMGAARQPCQLTANCRGRVLPAGPYAAQNNINRNGPFRQSQLGFIIIPAQQTYVVQVGETFVCTPPTTAAFLFARFGQS